MQIIQSGSKKFYENLMGKNINLSSAIQIDSVRLNLAVFLDCYLLRQEEIKVSTQWQIGCAIINRQEFQIVSRTGKVGNAIGCGFNF